MSSDRFALKRPCGDCPFRTDVEPYIRPERAKEIAESLRRDAEFPCHKTTTHEENEHGSLYVRTEKDKFCAGALITMDNEGFSNGSVRIAERLGMYDPQNMDMSSPVYPSLSDWVKSFSPPTKTAEVEFNGVVETLAYEHCGYVGEDCEDPADYSFGGGVSDNDDEPTCHPEDDCCIECGVTLCVACRVTHPDDQPWCPACAGEEE